MSLPGALWSWELLTGWPEVVPQLCLSHLGLWAMLLPGSLWPLVPLSHAQEIENVSLLLLPGSWMVWAIEEGARFSGADTTLFSLPSTELCCGGCTSTSSLPCLLGLWLIPRNWGYELCPSLSLPLFGSHYMCQYTYLQKYLCMALTGDPASWAEETLLGDKCPTRCRLKGRYKGVISLHHDGYVILSVLLLTGTWVIFCFWLL